MNIEERLELALNDFKQANTDITRLLEDHNKDLLWKPEPKKWSAAQSIEHILVTNEQYFPILEKRLNTEGDRSNNKQPYKPTFWGKMIYKAVDPALMKTKKSRTAKIFNPQPTVEIPTLIRRFEKDQKKLKGIIEKAFEVDTTQKIPSPLTGFVRFSLVDAMAIITKHEIRHYLQAKNVLALKE
jgi:hypothetical protein